MHDHSGNQVQVYRLSDLALLKTIRLPTNDGPNEPRVLQDGRTVLVNTLKCTLYDVTGLDGTDPQLELVHDEKQRGCGTPVVVGNYWVQADAPAHRVFSLDVRDVRHVREVSSVMFDERQRPHWLATDGSRIVVVNEAGPRSAVTPQRGTRAYRDTGHRCDPRSGPLFPYVATLSFVRNSRNVRNVLNGRITVRRREMVRMAVNKVRNALSDTVDLVAFKGERVILQRHGKDEAALISVADLALLEEFEDRADVAAAREALNESGERHNYEELRAELGLAK
ncbi:MAG: type II toxin-antitoxin system Phd/YefM family antitoxin [Gemmatimonadaceae bacterium]